MKGGGRPDQNVGQFIDGTLLSIMQYFEGMIYNFQSVVWKIAALLALCGIIWSCIQICFGTMEVRKFAVGIVTKWIFFLVCMTMYPAFVNGLFALASSVGDSASGTAIDELSKDLSEYYNNLKKLVNKKAEDYETAIKNLKDTKKKMDDSKASWIIGSYGYSASIMLDQEIEAKTAAWEKFQNEDSVWRTLKSLEEVLVIDDENVTDRYKMDLELKCTDSNGDVKGMGIISPAAVLKISILCGEILWNHEWTESVLTKWAENLGEDSIEGIDKHPLKKMTTFPVWRIFNMILAGICCIVLVIMTIVELIQYLMCVIEYSVTSSVCLVLVPCILFDGTKDMANKILPTLFAQAMKMCMIVICMYFGVWVYMRLLDDVVFTGGGMTLRLFSYVVFLVLLSFALVTNAPKIAATIMTGSPQMSMGEFVQTATAAAGAAMTAGHLIAGGGRMAAGGLSFARNRGGDLAEAAGAAAGAAKRSANNGGGNGRQALAALGGFTSNLASQTADRLRSAGGNLLSKGTLNPLKAYRGGGGAGGGSGGGGGFDRFNQSAKNSDGSRDYGKDKDGNPFGANSPGADHSSDRKYGNAYGSNGEKTTYGDWIRARFSAGQNGGKIHSSPKSQEKSAGALPDSPSPRTPSGGSPLGLGYSSQDTGLANRSNGGFPQDSSGNGGDGFPDLKFGSIFAPHALPDDRLSDAQKQIHNQRWGDKNSAEDAELI